MEQGEPERALPLYEEAATRASDPDQLAQARDQLGKAALRLGDVTRAESLAASLIETRPELARGYLLLAAVREVQGDQEGALAVYTDGAARAEDPLPLQLRAGDLLLRLGRAPEAQTLLEEAVRLNPRAPKRISVWRCLTSPRPTICGRCALSGPEARCKLPCSLIPTRRRPTARRAT